MFVQSIEELEHLLAGLRAARGDYQWVEAKRARSAMPTDLWNSLSALANSGVAWWYSESTSSVESSPSPELRIRPRQHGLCAE